MPEIRTDVPLKIVIQMELERLENDKHIAALYYSMVSDNRLKQG